MSGDGQEDYRERSRQNPRNADDIEMETFAREMNQILGLKPGQSSTFHPSRRRELKESPPRKRRSYHRREIPKSTFQQGRDEAPALAKRSVHERKSTPPLPQRQTPPFPQRHSPTLPKCQTPPQSSYGSPFSSRVQFVHTCSTPSMQSIPMSASVPYICFPQHNNQTHATHAQLQTPFGYPPGHCYPIYIPSYYPTPTPMLITPDSLNHQYSPQNNWNPPSSQSPQSDQNSCDQKTKINSAHVFSRPNSQIHSNQNQIPRRPENSYSYLPSHAPVAATPSLVFMIAPQPSQMFCPPPMTQSTFTATKETGNQHTTERPRMNQLNQPSSPSKPKQEEVYQRSIGTSPMTPRHYDSESIEVNSAYSEPFLSSDDELSEFSMPESVKTETDINSPEETEEKEQEFAKEDEIPLSPQSMRRTPPVQEPTASSTHLKIAAVSCHKLKNFCNFSPLSETPSLSPIATSELEEKLEKTLTLLHDRSWQKQFAGLADLTGHLRNPSNYPIINNIMSRVVSALLKMIRSTRTRLSLEAIRTARFLLTCLGKRLDNFLCPLGLELFSKTIPAAKFIKDEAEKALQVAVHRCSPHRVIHLLESKAGGRHKNGKVRTAAASLTFMLINDVIGPQTTLRLYAKEILPLLFEWWDEPQVLIRSLATYSLSLFVPYKAEFERAIQNHVNIDVEIKLREKLQRLINNRNMGRRMDK